MAYKKYGTKIINMNPPAGGATNKNEIPSITKTNPINKGKNIPT
jgi:hypothetical protein